MKYRTVIMYTEIGCFLACVCGWILVSSTLVIRHWCYSEVARTVIMSGHIFSNLWKDCLTDSTGMTDCKEFPSLLALQLYLHVCRALVISSVFLGLFGHVLVLVGMKCTKLGGSEVTNAKITFTAGMTYLSSGLCAVCTYSWYGNRIVSEFMDPTFIGKKYELGSALYIGWGGSALLLAAGFVYCILAGKECCQPSPKEQEALVYSPTESPAFEEMEPIKKEDEEAPSPPPESEIKKTEGNGSSVDLAKAYSKGEYV